MNWDAIGAISELVGAVAVVATLAYLSIQIRQNTRSMEDSRKVELSRNHQDLTELRSNMMLHISGSGELAEIYVRARSEGVESLTAPERMRVQMRERVNMHVNATVFYQYELGLAEQRQFEMSKRIFDANKTFWESLDIDLQYHLDWIEKLDRRDA